MHASRPWLSCFRAAVQGRRGGPGRCIAVRDRRWVCCAAYIERVRDSPALKVAPGLQTEHAVPLALRVLKGQDLPREVLQGVNRRRVIERIAVLLAAGVRQRCGSAAWQG